jgi:hypothetical protein
MKKVSPKDMTRFIDDYSKEMFKLIVRLSLPTCRKPELIPKIKEALDNNNITVGIADYIFYYILTERQMYAEYVRLNKQWGTILYHYEVMFYTYGAKGLITLTH